MTAEPRILVVGYNAFDVTVVLEQPPPRDGKLEVPPILLGGGGPGATAAVALARLGARVRLLTPLTDDEAGRRQRRELTAAGVDFRGSPVHPDTAGAMAVILVHPQDGSRSILWSRGEVPALPVPADTEALLAETDLLYLDGHEPAAGGALARAARRRGLPVVMDAGSVREGSRELVPLCTDVISSGVFAPAYTGQTEPAPALRDLAAAGPERVAMTFGADGLLWWDGARCRGLPAFAVPVVDTTGAGDAFHAGYAFARARGEEFVTALRWGAAVAALKCRGWGGRRALPDRPTVEELLRNGPVRPPGPPVDAYCGPE